MHQMDLLVDIILIFSFSLVINLVLSRLRQPAILGYILSGLIIGPYGFGWISHDELELFAEVGIVLLMFTLGIEFSLDRIRRVKTIALGGGTLQVGLTILVTSGISYLLGWDWYRGVYLGCLVALSSSAIVLKLLQEGGDLDTLHGRISLGILLYQDLALVPMMIILPAIAAPQEGLLVPLFSAAGRAVLFLAAALLFSRLILPRLFFQIAKTRSRELFLLMVIALCLGTAWVSNLSGLSLALGAFVAGMVVSDSDYSLRILSDILPFKDVFLAVFFVSVGMLFNPGFVIANPQILSLVVALVLVVNFLICTLVVMLFRYPLRVAVFTGAALSQIGEFSFVLAQLGLKLGLIGDYLYQLTLAGTILTMAMTPQMLKLGKKLPEWMKAWGVPERFIHGAIDETLEKGSLRDHVIICGFGPVGQHVERVLKEHGFPCIVLELNAPRVHTLREQGVAVYYGDSSSTEVLHAAGLNHARAVTVTYADPHAARRTVAAVKSLSSHVPIVTRTRLPEDVSELRRLGANRVVEEEFEVSLEMSAWVLEALGVSRLAIQSEQAAIREDDYRLFTDQKADLTALHELIETFPSVELAICEVQPQSAISGKTLAEIGLRSRMGVTVLAVGGQSARIFNPAATQRIQPGDNLVLIGEKSRIEEARRLIETKRLL